MENSKHIKNVGIIAHIDHGKTTLSDILLSKSGIISKSIAGDARVLDFLDEEQKRGITIKAANISLLADNYIINLVDTPGHVDFSGKVTRALRVIDGVIVVVDAVEGCMVQTEILTRQAMQELIRPVLFINKIDRLIKELKLNESKIQKRLDLIIQIFNKILKNNLPDYYYEKWKIVPHKNNVVFGSALHHWGFTFRQMIQTGKKFNSIMEIYEKYDDIFNYRKFGYDLFPLDAAIIDAIITNIPSPNSAQSYRIPRIWKGDINSKLGKNLVECDSSGITLIEINKIINDIHSGRIAVGRIFSGTIKIGDKLFLLNKQDEFRVLNLYIYMGANKNSVKEIKAGNIIGLSGNKDLLIGETLIDWKYKNLGFPFEQIHYNQDPVMTISIEPYHPRELKKMVEILQKISIEDPNLEIIINNDTGEYLISGMGELHLEIIKKEIEDLGIKIITSKPLVIYTESIYKESNILNFKSNDDMFSIEYQIRPLDQKILDLFQKGTIYHDLPPDELKSILINFLDESENVNKDKLNFSIIGKNNILITYLDTHQKVINKKRDEYNQFLINLFKLLLQKGPLIREKIFGLKIMVNNSIIDESLLNLGPIMIVKEFQSSFLMELNKLNPIILEPIYKIQIITPSNYIGKCTSIIESRRGKIDKIEPEGSYSKVTGYIPVSETFNLSNEIRSKTSGWAFWQTVFSHWQKIPDNKLEELIKNK